MCRSQAPFIASVIALAFAFQFLTATHAVRAQDAAPSAAVGVKPGEAMIAPIRRVHPAKPALVAKQRAKPVEGKAAAQAGHVGGTRGNKSAGVPAVVTAKAVPR